MATVIPQTLRERLELYRSLLRREPGVEELGRLVALLESELTAADATDPSPASARDRN